MDHLWTPWRFGYVTRTKPEQGCIFCLKAESRNDKENFVVYRAEHNFVMLNIYPYNNGHLMIAPYAHVATMQEASEQALLEMMKLARLSERHLGTIYRPKGINLGMNLGECAGAGVAGHIHMHILPRWPGDVNFMTTIAETRVMPEDLRVSFENLSKAFHLANT